MDKALIFNIMRYSVHDGPGIRTTVFFKGCPLSCRWCHNPESLAQKPELVFNPGKCIKCGNCRDYLKEAGGNPQMAADNCPTGARETVGYEISLSGLMKEIKKDLLFYEQSGGGVTFSGGEPLFQAEFLLEALKMCREDYINTAIDTSGFCDTADLLKAAEMADYFLYDIKFMDSRKHEEYCGAPNDLVLKNLECLAGTDAKLLLRIPIIPTINDDMQEMGEIFEFVKGMKNIETVHLLPYHNIHSEKYKRLGKEYSLMDIPGDESPNMGAIKDLFARKFRTKVGG